MVNQRDLISFTPLIADLCVHYPRQAGDAARSASRTIQNNFLDSNKQEAMDILLQGNSIRLELADKARAVLDVANLHSKSSPLQRCYFAGFPRNSVFSQIFSGNIFFLKGEHIYIYIYMYIILITFCTIFFYP